MMSPPAASAASVLGRNRSPARTRRTSRMTNGVRSAQVYHSAALHHAAWSSVTGRPSATLEM